MCIIQNDTLTAAIHHWRLQDYHRSALAFHAEALQQGQQPCLEQTLMLVHFIIFCLHPFVHSLVIPCLLATVDMLHMCFNELRFLSAEFTLIQFVPLAAVASLQ